MLANLPAKRAVRQIIPNLTPKPTKKIIVPTRGRNKILVKQKGPRGFKLVTASTTLNTIGNTIALRKKRNAESLRLSKSGENVVERRTRSSLKTPTEVDEPQQSTKPIEDIAEIHEVKKETDLAKAIRKKTKTVVAKISNTFRRGNAKRMLRAATTAKPDRSKPAAANDINAKTKSKGFLRTLSFRRSKRNANAAVETEDKKDDSKEANVAVEEMPTETPSILEETPELVAPTKDESSTVPSKVVETVPEAPPAPNNPAAKSPILKRKKSLKSIINTIRNKCQQKQSAEETVPETVAEQDEPVDLSVSAAAPVEPAAPQPPAPIEKPLVIETMDEPMNLSLKRRDSSPPSSLPSPAPSTDSSTAMVSPTPKRRIKKLNDCIAMLTGKLQEKLGVPFLEPNLHILTVPVVKPPILLPEYNAEPKKVHVSKASIVAPATSNKLDRERSGKNEQASNDAKKMLPVPEIRIENVDSKSINSSDQNQSEKEILKINSSIAPTLRNEIVIDTTSNVNSSENNRMVAPLNEARKSDEQSTSVIEVAVPQIIATNQIEKEQNLQTAINEILSKKELTPRKKREMPRKSLEKSLEKILKLPEVKSVSPSRTSPRNPPKKLTEISTKKDETPTPSTTKNDAPAQNDLNTENAPEKENIIEAKTTKSTAYENDNKLNPNQDEHIFNILEDFEANIASSVIEKQAIIKEADEKLRAEEQKLDKQTQQNKKPARKKATPSDKKKTNKQTKPIENQTIEKEQPENQTSEKEQTPETKTSVELIADVETSVPDDKPREEPTMSIPDINIAESPKSSRKNRKTAIALDQKSIDEQPILSVSDVAVAENTKSSKKTRRVEALLNVQKASDEPSISSVTPAETIDTSSTKPNKKTRSSENIQDQKSTEEQTIASITSDIIVVDQSPKSNRRARRANVVHDQKLSIEQTISSVAADVTTPTCTPLTSTPKPSKKTRQTDVLHDKKSSDDQPISSITPDIIDSDDLKSNKKTRRAEVVKEPEQKSAKSRSAKKNKKSENENIQTSTVDSIPITGSDSGNDDQAKDAPKTSPKKATIAETPSKQKVDAVTPEESAQVKKSSEMPKSTRKQNNIKEAPATPRKSTQEITSVDLETEKSTKTSPSKTKNKKKSDSKKVKSDGDYIHENVLIEESGHSKQSDEAIPETRTKSRREAPFKSNQIEKKSSQIPSELTEADEPAQAIVPRQSRPTSSARKRSGTSKAKEKFDEIPATETIELLKKEEPAVEEKPLLTKTRHSSRSKSKTETEKVAVDRKETIVKRDKSVTQKSKGKASSQGKSFTDDVIVTNADDSKNLSRKIRDNKSLSKEKILPASKSKATKITTSAKKGSKARSYEKGGFDSSEDELLPWDPEIGFVHNNKTVPEKAEEVLPEPKSNVAETSTEEQKDKPIKKKRKNELAQIIADQLLESFKEMDELRLNELKKINDLTNCNDLLNSTFSTTPIPKRRAKQVANEVSNNLKTCAEEVPHVDEEKSIKKPSKSSNSKSKAHSPIETLKDSPFKNDDIHVNEAVTSKTASAEPKSKKSSKKDSSKRKRLDEPIDNVEETDKQTETPTKTTPKTKTVPANSRKGKKNTSKSPDSSPVETKSATQSKPEPAIKDFGTSVKETGALVEEKNIFLAEFNRSLFKETLLNQQLDHEAPKKPPVKEAAPKVPENELFITQSNRPSDAMPKAIIPDLVAQIIDDFTTSTIESKSGSSPAISESIFSATPVKSSCLSELFNKSVRTSEGSTHQLPKNKLIENVITFEKINNLPAGNRAPFMSPMWEPEDKNDSTAAGKAKIPMVADNKVNFWNRNKDEMAKGKKDIFGLVKSKTKKILNKMSKKKLKKSLKSSINSSSSSSSSSSCPSPLNTLPKKPLLRPSILSCKNFSEDHSEPKDTGDIANFITADKDKGIDVFDALKMSVEIPAKPVLAEPVLSRKMGSIRRRGGKSHKEPVDFVGPKSPIESDMNIAKIAIALDSSRREKLQLDEAPTDKLNNAFREDARPSAVKNARDRKSGKTKENSSKSTVKQATTPVILTDKPSAASPPFDNDDESSQDTIISQIISKIRENAERSESDDDLCLADVAKGLTRRSIDEFDSGSTIELSESRMEKNFSALVSDINKRLESPPPDQQSDDQDSQLDSGLVEGFEDENTNTEVVDMDLEDDISVYTGISIDTSIASGGTAGENRKKRRKKKSILSRSRKVKKVDGEFVSPPANYFCDLCNKSFSKPSALTSHKMTISHISKVSAQEFLDSKNKESHTQPDEKVDEPEAKAEPKRASPEKEIPDDKTATVNAKLENKENVEKNTSQKTPIQPSLPQKNPAPEAHNQLDVPAISLIPSPNHFNAFSGQHFEPLSSPEQGARFNTTSNSKHISTVSSSVNSRLALSQEERLFYECCSMLKGSERSTSSSTIKGDLISKPVTPKSNELNSNIAHSAQSPRSHSSPRPGIPKLDVDNFSDQSSDSNPAYSCPQIPSSSKTQKVFSLEEETTNTAKSKSTADSTSLQKTSASPLINFFKKSVSSGSDHRQSNNTYPNSSIIVRNYPDTYSDMGDSFPSSQDASESEHYAQTVLERSSNTLNASATNIIRSPGSSKYEDIRYGLSASRHPINSDAESRAYSHRFVKFN